MPSFKDAKKRTWTIELTDAERDCVADAAGVERGLGVNAFAKEIAKPERAVAALWAALRPAFEANGLSLGDFTRRVLLKPKPRAVAFQALIAAMATTDADKILVEALYAS